MRSFFRSTMEKYPSSSIFAMSPVSSHPSRRTAAVSAGWFQYPFITCGPRTASSPASFGGMSLDGSWVHELRVRIWERDADALLDDAVDRIAMGHRRRFREAVALDESPACRGLELPPHFVRQRRRARDAGAHGPQVVLRQVRIPEDRDIHRGDAREEARPRLVDQLEDRVDLARIRVEDDFAGLRDREEHDGRQ